LLSCFRDRQIHRSCKREWERREGWETERKPVVADRIGDWQRREEWRRRMGGRHTIPVANPLSAVEGGPTLDDADVCTGCEERDGKREQEAQTEGVKEVDLDAA
jgi:hypothetical protein